MLRTTRSPSRFLARTGAVSVSALLTAGAALFAGTPAGAATDAGIAEYVPPASTTLTVPTPYDDLSSQVCDGASAYGPANILAANGGDGDVYALPGDTVQLVGVAKGCQKRYAGDTSSLTFGFLASEVGWEIQPAGGAAAQSLGQGTI